MDESRLRTIAQLQEFLDATTEVSFTGTAGDGDAQRYEHISRVLRRFDYPQRGKPERGVLLAYLRRTSGYSRTQITRLVARWDENRLADSKNASVVRKHMGYSHIPKKYAKPINAFYEGVFNSWLNLHRPCMYATEIVSDKGKIKKVYKHEDVKTPLECLVLLNEKDLVTFKAGITLEDLLAQASEKTDLQAAQEMQKAKAELFELFNKHRRKQQA